ncbi:MAG: transcription elongation factor GreA [Planctomycetota bacterium]|nr:MAG: transcription elongation factor GreA [Planctomycetota bacterium]
MHDIMPISKTGHKKLKEELVELEAESVVVRQRVKEAREQGDLKENAEYIYGRQNLGFIEGRMGEIRGKLNFSKVTDCTEVPCDKAAFGTVVTLRNTENDAKMVFQLLGPYDADLTDDSISIASPIGEAMLDHTVGDTFTATVPRGDIEFEVLEINKSEIK